MKQTKIDSRINGILFLLVFLLAPVGIYIAKTTNSMYIKIIGFICASIGFLVISLVIRNSNLRKDEFQKMMALEVYASSFSAFLLFSLFIYDFRSHLQVSA